MNSLEFLKIQEFLISTAPMLPIKHYINENGNEDVFTFFFYIRVGSRVFSEITFFV